MGSPISSCYQRPCDSPGWHRTAYRYAIACWLTECRESHRRVCPCRHFRDHWRQGCLSEFQSVGTQTEWTPASAPIPVPYPPPVPRKRTTARGVIFQPSDTHDPTALSTATLVTSSGRALGGHSSESTSPVRRPGGNRGPRRRLVFASDPSGIGSSATRNHSVIVNKSGGSDPWPSDDSFSDEDLMSIVGEDGAEDVFADTLGEDTGTGSSANYPDGNGPFEASFGDGSSIHIQDPTQSREPARTTFSHFCSRV